MTKKTISILITFIIIISIGALIYNSKKPVTPVEEGTPIVNEPISSVGDSIVGCYVSRLAKDVYSLNIAKQQGENVSGTLVFKNFEKDSSSGPFEGTYKDGVLLGLYSFNSEGMASVMQVIFKKEVTSFVRGYGPMNQAGDRFANLNDITYDPKQTFISSGDACATSLTVSSTNSTGILSVGETKVISGISIKLNSVVSDSRCPTDVQCIQAGQVVASVTLRFGSQIQTVNMSSDGAPQVFAGYKISITDVNPKTLSTKKIESKEYKVVFKVEK